MKHGDIIELENLSEEMKLLEPKCPKKRLVILQIKRRFYIFWQTTPCCSCRLKCAWGERCKQSLLFFRAVDKNVRFKIVGNIFRG